MPQAIIKNLKNEVENILHLTKYQKEIIINVNEKTLILKYFQQVQTEITNLYKNIEAKFLKIFSDSTLIISLKLKFLYFLIDKYEFTKVLINEFLSNLKLLKSIEVQQIINNLNKNLIYIDEQIKKFVIEKNKFEKSLKEIFDPNGFQKIVRFFNGFNNQKTAFDLEYKINKANTLEDLQNIVKEKLFKNFSDLKDLIDNLQWKFINQAKKTVVGVLKLEKNPLEFNLEIGNDLKTKTAIKIFFKNLKSDAQVLQDLVKDIRETFNVDKPKPGIKIKADSQFANLTVQQFKQKLQSFPLSYLPDTRKDDITIKEFTKILVLPNSWLIDLTGLNFFNPFLKIQIFYSFFSSQIQEKNGILKLTFFLKLIEQTEWRNFDVSIYGFK